MSGGKHWTQSAQIIEPGTVGQWAKGLLVLAAVIDLLSGLSGVATFIYLSGLKDGSGVKPATANMLDQLSSFLGLCQIVVLIAASIPILKWFYRTYNNVGALTKWSLSYTPSFVGFPSSLRILLTSS